MKYNPLIHHRRSIRLKGYDYSQADSYFITICCQDMKCRFGKIAVAAVVGAPLAGAQSAQMELNEFGTIAYNEWIKLPQRFPNFELDVFQIMPNHIHGIITLTVRATLAVAPDVVQPQGLPVHIAHDDNRAGVNPAPTTVGDIVGAYKSLVANACLEIYKSNHVGTGFTPVQIPFMGKLWQRNYYEHIIRNEQSYQNISDYIISNPAKWNQDKFYSI